MANLERNTEEQIKCTLDLKGKFSKRKASESYTINYLRSVWWSAALDDSLKTISEFFTLFTHCTHLAYGVPLPLSQCVQWKKERGGKGGRGKITFKL